MFFDYSDEQTALRRELRPYLEALAGETADDVNAPGDGDPRSREAFRRLGKDGWLGVGWPKEYGGQGRPAIDQYVFFDEVQRAGVPFPFVTVNTIGPALMRFGSDEQKQRFLPQILAGEVNFAVGYTEPESGTDLASLRTSAVLDGDHWIVNGGKVFTSGANQADFIWLATRTDPDLPKHKGISILLCPTDSPGFRWTPIVTVGDNTTTATYYDDVRVPGANLVGERGAGWSMITTQLNHERVGLAALGGATWRMWFEVLTWAKATTAAEGGLVIDRPWVRADLAKCYARLEGMKLLNWRMADSLGRDQLDPADSSATKFYGTEAHVEVYRLLNGVLGAGAWLRPGSPGALLHGRVERLGRSAQINTFGGGVNEVQREIVAAAGLKMARRAR